MKISKISPWTGNENSMEIAIDEFTLARINNPKRGDTIQDVVPHLTADEREFLLTGATVEDWEAMFPPEDDEVGEGE